MKSTTAILIALTASFAIACGPKNNGETNNGENNVNAQTNNETTVTTNNETNNETTVTTNNETNNPTNNQTNQTNNGTPGTCDAYCDTVMANCTGDDEQYDSREACIDYCENVAGWDPGSTTDTDGNTIGCRIYHGGAPAAGEPATHCPHAGPTGGDVCGSWCDNYCQLSSRNCSGANELYADDAECMAACTDIPASGTAGDVEYDTVQCRLYHAGAPAAGDPDTHCPHVAEEATAFCVGQPTDFNFRTDAPDAYTRVDRMGMPAVSTALIQDKNGYNDASPTDDVAGTYVSEIVATLTAYHDALDDDLANASLVPCTMDDTDGDSLPDCVGQEVVGGGPTVADLVLPDTIKIDPDADPGFPNGRLLADPVMDVTLAIILLDMSDASQDPTTLAGLPLNPSANDLGVEGAFLTSFPYLHPPHTQ